MQDPRRTTKGNFHYPLEEILFLVIAAVLSGVEDWTSIAYFGNTKLEWLRRFFPYKHGVPSHDVLGKLFSSLDPVKFGECFTSWVNTISNLTEGEVIAIDGKSICGSGDSGSPKSALHIVSAAIISKTLFKAYELSIDKSVNELKDWMITTMNKNQNLNVEYVEIVDELNLQPVKNWEEKGAKVACVAAFCGKVRLIDNIVFN